MQKAPLPFLWIIVIGTTLLILLVAVLWLWQPGKTVPQTISSPPAAVTAELAPTSASKPLPAISPALASAIRQHSSHSPGNLPQRSNPDGSVSLEHGTHYQSVMVATRDAEGNLVIRHGEDFLPHVNASPAP